MLYNKSLDVGHDECESRAKREQLTDLDGRAVGCASLRISLGARNGFTARGLHSPLLPPYSKTSSCDRTSRCLHGQGTKTSTRLGL